ncbi:MAG: DMT family transporter [Bacteroidales bacterium]|jgi:drug/metabolite transporter (DMT)-like permease|nr:DMT family transporter [Bacteroidales bacterium]NLK80185.1 DMT family transporter [Bacteroidales bacterium]HPX79389.1 DMT family transporter [Bacteroidales bacterium]
MRGETIALGVAVFWTLSALFFEHAGKRLGSVNLNLIRLVCAFLMIGLTLLLFSGNFLPVGADKATWWWMSLSGLVGFVMGDYFLFASYNLIQARFSQLIMTLAPPFAAVFGFLLLGEKMSWMALAGMLLTLTGISISILRKQNGTNTHKLRMQLPVKGVLFALVGALGQGVGIVLSKQGMLAYEKVYQPANALYIPLAATQMRTITGMVLFALIILIKGDTKRFVGSLKDKKAVRSAVTGSVFGPYIGVTLSLMAVQHANTAVASTIMATVPILILLPEYFFLKRRITWEQVVGAVLSVGGVALFFL